MLSAIFPRLGVELLLLFVIFLLLLEHLDLIEDAGLSKRLLGPLGLPLLSMSSLLKVMLDQRISALGKGTIGVLHVRHLLEVKLVNWVIYEGLPLLDWLHRAGKARLERDLPLLKLSRLDPWGVRPIL